MPNINADRTKTLKALADDMPSLPPESVRMLRFVARESADVIAQAEAFLRITLPPHARARLIDECLSLETRAAVRALRDETHALQPCLN